MDELLVKFGEMLDEKLETKVGQILEEKLEPAVERLRMEIGNSEEKLRKEMLDRYFLFEQEYGDKIISMGDYILFDKDKNERINNQVCHLENRVDRLEVKSLVYENDIFKLKHQKVTKN